MVVLESSAMCVKQLPPHLWRVCGLRAPFYCQSILYWVSLLVSSISLWERVQLTRLFLDRSKGWAWDVNLWSYWCSWGMEWCPVLWNGLFCAMQFVLRCCKYAKYSKHCLTQSARDISVIHNNSSLALICVVYTLQCAVSVCLFSICFGQAIL